MAKIIKQRQLGLNLYANDAFMGGNVAESPSLKYKAIERNENDNSGYFFVEYRYELNSLNSKFSFNGDITWQYELSPKKEITVQDLLGCIEHTRLHLQHIVNAIYSKQQAVIQIKNAIDEEHLQNLEKELALWDRS